MTSVTPEPVVALAGAADLTDLRAFTCAEPGVGYQQQVEDFIRTSLLSGPPMSEYRSYEPFTLRSRGRLVGVMALRAWPEAPGAGGAELVVGAIAVDAQGSRTPTGESLAAFLMRSMLQAVRDAGHGPFVSAIVARANTRSINMLQRSGIARPLNHDRDHLRLVGTLPTVSRPAQPPGLQDPAT